jgi:hypothetical protein
VGWEELDNRQQIQYRRGSCRLVECSKNYEKRKRCNKVKGEEGADLILLGS